MAEIIKLDALSEADVDQLTALLGDAVANGASVGYLIPADQTALALYWRGVAQEIASGDIGLVAARDDGRIVGSAQLQFCQKPNGRHRAEVQKVLVHSASRRQGIGRALMAALEHQARAGGRQLLVLDTETDSSGQHLYAALGYLRAGAIPRFAIGTAGGWAETTYMYKFIDPA